MKTTLFMIAVVICGGLLFSSFQHSGSLEATADAVNPSTALNAVDSIHVDPIINYPDPFCGVTTIRYEVVSDSWVRLSVICPNLRVETLVFAYHKAGTYEVEFDACLKPCGNYVAELETYYCKEKELMTKIRSQVAPLPGIE